MATKDIPCSPAIGSLSGYISAALKHARHESLDDGRWFAEILGLEGVWGHGNTIEECLADLQTALEDWILVGLVLQHDIPDVDGHTLHVEKVA